MHFFRTFFLGFFIIGCSYSTTLSKRSLSSYPQAVCNDGTPAAYYTSDEMGEWSSVVVYLQEGGGCATVEDCIERCEVSNPELCTEDTADDHDLTYTMWSEDPEENPPFHNFYKIFVPYCSSDVYTGKRNASEDTGNYFFHGKFIIQAILEDMIREIPGMKDIQQLVLIGGSAGAFGVGYNCDFAAEYFHAENPSVDVRCIADGGDFYPTWVSTEGCEPYELGKAASEFWSSELDQSCEYLTEDDHQDCLIFPSYFTYIDTPMMVVTNYVDTSLEVHPCTPAVDQDDEFWDIWRDQMMSLANTFMEVT